MSSDTASKSARVGLEYQELFAGVKPLLKDKVCLPLIEDIIVWNSTMQSAIDSATEEISTLKRLFESATVIGNASNAALFSNLPRAKPTRGRFEYHHMTPVSSNVAGDVSVVQYSVHAFPINPETLVSVSIHPETTYALTESQVIAIHNLINEKNSATSEMGHWAVAAINLMNDCGKIGVMIKFHPDASATSNQENSFGSKYEDNCFGESKENVDEDLGKSAGKEKQSPRSHQPRYTNGSSQTTDSAAGFYNSAAGNTEAITAELDINDKQSFIEAIVFKAVAETLRQLHLTPPLALNDPVADIPIPPTSSNTEDPAQVSTPPLNPSGSNSKWLTIDSRSNVCSWGSMNHVSGSSWFSPQAGKGVRQKSRGSVLYSTPKVAKSKPGPSTEPKNGSIHFGAGTQDFEQVSNTPVSLADSEWYTTSDSASSSSQESSDYDQFDVQPFPPPPGKGSPGPHTPPPHTPPPHTPPDIPSSGQTSNATATPVNYPLVTSGINPSSVSLDEYTQCGSQSLAQVYTPASPSSENDTTVVPDTVQATQGTISSPESLSGSPHIHIHPGHDESDCRFCTLARSFQDTPLALRNARELLEGSKLTQAAVDRQPLCDVLCTDSKLPLALDCTDNSIAPAQPNIPSAGLYLESSHRIPRAVSYAGNGLSVPQPYIASAIPPVPSFTGNGVPSAAPYRNNNPLSRLHIDNSSHPAQSSGSSPTFQHREDTPIPQLSPEDWNSHNPTAIDNGRASGIASFNSNKVANCTSWTSRQSPASITSAQTSTGGVPIQAAMQEKNNAQVRWEVMSPAQSAHSNRSSTAQPMNFASRRFSTPFVPSLHSSPGGNFGDPKPSPTMCAIPSTVPVCATENAPQLFGTIPPDIPMPTPEPTSQYTDISAPIFPVNALHAVECRRPTWIDAKQVMAEPHDYETVERSNKHYVHQQNSSWETPAANMSIPILHSPMFDNPLRRNPQVLQGIDNTWVNPGSVSRYFNGVAPQISPFDSPNDPIAMRTTKRLIPAQPPLLSDIYGNGVLNSGYNLQGPGAEGSLNDNHDNRYLRCNNLNIEGQGYPVGGSTNPYGIESVIEAPPVLQYPRKPNYIPALPAAPAAPSNNLAIPDSLRFLFERPPPANQMFAPANPPVQPMNSGWHDPEMVPDASDEGSDEENPFLSCNGHVYRQGNAISYN